MRHSSETGAVPVDLARFLVEGALPLGLGLQACGSGRLCLHHLDHLHHLDGRLCRLCSFCSLRRRRSRRLLRRLVLHCSVHEVVVQGARRDGARCHGDERHVVGLSAGGRASWRRSERTGPRPTDPTRPCGNNSWSEHAVCLCLCLCLYVYLSIWLSLRPTSTAQLLQHPRPWKKKRKLSDSSPSPSPSLSLSGASPPEPAPALAPAD